jgi:hypothetical protein
MPTVHLSFAGIDIDEEKIKKYSQETGFKEATKIAKKHGLEIEVQEFYIKYRENGAIEAKAYNDALFQWNL